MTLVPSHAPREQERTVTRPLALGSGRCAAFSFPGLVSPALLVCLLSYLGTQRAFLLLQKRMSVTRFVSLPSSFPFFSFCFCSHHLPAQPDHKGVRMFAIVT